MLSPPLLFQIPQLIFIHKLVDFSRYRYHDQQINHQVTELMRVYLILFMTRIATRFSSPFSSIFHLFWLVLPESFTIVS